LAEYKQRFLSRSPKLVPFLLSPLVVSAHVKCVLFDPIYHSSRLPLRFEVASWNLRFSRIPKVELRSSLDLSRIRRGHDELLRPINVQ